MSVNEAKTAILNNKTALGIEFGSTRIKAVLVDDKYNPIASGSYDWENQLVDNVWTYSMEKIQNGLRFRSDGGACRLCLGFLVCGILRYGIPDACTGHV